MKTGKSEIAVKSIVILFWMILVCAAESSLFPRLKLFDCVPSCLPFIVGAVAVIDGPWAGLFCGLGAGFLADGVGGQSFCLYTVLYMILGTVVGVVSPGLFRKSFLAVIGWGCVIHLLSEFLRFFLFFYLFGKADISAVGSVLLPGFLYSLILSPLAVAPVFILRRLFKDSEPIVR